MIYSFIFYLLTVYFMVILPLPSQSSVAALTTPTMNLHPFEFVRQFMKYSPFVLTDPGTYKGALISASFIQPAFNLLLTLPFGVYLRYYFKRNWRQTQLWLIIIPFIFFWTADWLAYTGTVSEKDLPQTLLVVGVSVAIVAVYLLHLLVSLFFRNPRLIYEKISKTRTIAVKKDRTHE